MKFFQKYISFVFAATFLVSCATKRENLEINNAFFSQPSTVVIAQISGLDKPEYYKTGNQGLLEFAICEAVGNSISKKIHEIKASPIVEEYYYNAFRKAFESKGYKPIIATSALDREELKRFAQNEEKYAVYDLISLKNQYKANYAMILAPHAFGAKRSYYSFVPTSAPCGYAEVKFYLVNLTDNSIVGHYNGSMEMPVVGEWDNPPEYPELVRASQDSLIKVIKNAYAYFFKTDMNRAIN